MFLFAHSPIEYEFSNRYIGPIDGILTGTTLQGESGPGRNSNEGEVYTPQISRTGASLSDVLYLGHSFLEWGALIILQDIQSILCPANRESQDKVDNVWLP